VFDPFNNARVIKPTVVQAPYKPGKGPQPRPEKKAMPVVPVRENVEAAAREHAHTLSIQRKLVAMGYKIAVDGKFGDDTWQAWKLSHQGKERNYGVASPKASKAAAKNQVDLESAIWGKNGGGFVQGIQTPEAPKPRLEPLPSKHSTEPRFEPRYPGEPEAGWVGLGPDRKPTYNDAYTATMNTRRADDENANFLGDATLGADTLANVKKATPTAHPAVVGTVDAIASGVPLVASAKGIRDGNFGAGDVAIDAINAALIWSPGTMARPILAGVRAARAARAADAGVLDSFTAARAAVVEMKTARREAPILRRARQGQERADLEAMLPSASRQRFIQTMTDASYTKREQKNMLNVWDRAALAKVKEGNTPEQAWDSLLAHSEYHDVSVTADDIQTGRHAFAQEGERPEIQNLSATPEEFMLPPSPDFIKKQAARLARKHKAALPEGFNTPGKLNALLVELRARAIEAAAYRKWYEQSSRAIVRHVRGDLDEANKIAGLIAVYSPRAEVYSKNSSWNNLDRALNAYNDYQETGQIGNAWSISKKGKGGLLKEGEADWQTYRAQQIMEGKFNDPALLVEKGDIKSWNGLKTNRFYRNFLQHIDPERYKALFGDEKFGTMDTWLRRAFRYPKKYATEERETLFGVETVNVGKPNETITDPMYHFMEEANKIVGDSLGWSPEEVQAAIWTSVKAEVEGTPLESAGFDFSHAFAHRETKIAEALRPAQLSLDDAIAAKTTDKPLLSNVNDAIEASRSPDSGFTLTIGLNPDVQIAPDKGRFIVAYGAYEQRWATPLTQDALLDYRTTHLDLLRSDSSLRIGGWNNPDDNQIYLDVSRLFDTHDEAMQFGREQGQLSIFDRQNPDASLPTGLEEAAANALKDGHRETYRLAGRRAEHESLLERAHVMWGGKLRKNGGISEAQAREAEKNLGRWARDNPDTPEAQAYGQLSYDATLANNSPDPSNFFQKGTGNLKGLPEGRSANATAQSVAGRYMEDAGLPYHPPKDYAEVDPARAKRIAEWFDNAESKPNDPEVRASYDAFARETKAQYDAIVESGYRFEFYPTHDPYAGGPSEAIDDLRANKHMFVYPTDEGFGTLTAAEKSHPSLGDSGVVWAGRPVTHNDLFRAVHDYMGHFKEGVGFRAAGEENAWRAHVAMYSPEARPAMTAETRGQNSWINYGPHGEANQTAKQATTVFADQKAVLAPDWVVGEGSGAAKAAGNPIKGLVRRHADGTHELHLYKGADVSTVMHELAHVLEPAMSVAARDALKAAHAAIRTGESYDEFVARSFERYLLRGDAPTEELAGAMREIAVDMARIYKGSDVPGGAVSDELKQVFDTFFTREGKSDPAFAAKHGAAWLAQEGETSKPIEHKVLDVEGGLTPTFLSDGRPTTTDKVEQALAGEGGQPFHLHVNDADGKLQGAMHGTVKEDGTMHLAGTYVLPESRSQGISTALHNAARKYATDNDLKMSADFQNARLGEQQVAKSVAEGRPVHKDERGRTFFQEGADEPAPEELLDEIGQEASLTPEEKVREGMKGARTRFGVQKAARREEARARSAKVDHALRSIADPDEAMAAAKAAMQGEYFKIDFQGLTVLDADALRHLKSHVNQLDTLLPFQKIRLNDSLTRAVEDHRVPTPSETRLIEHVFGKQNAISIVGNTANSWGDVVLNILNVPRTIMATADLSAVGRQSLVAGASHPILWAQSWPTMLKAMKSPTYYKRVTQDIKEDPLYNLALAADISFTDVAEGAGIRMHEEAFQSDYAARIWISENIPQHGHIIQGSARAYTAFLNKMRMDMFKQQIRGAMKAGRDINDEEFLTDIGKVINAATGRGTINQRAEHLMPALNTMLFSPRLMLSRLNYLDPTWYMRLSGPARKEALRGLFATAGLVSSTLFLISRIPGIDVEIDPRNSNFGKLRLGDTRIDIAGGFQQYIKLASVLVTQTKISSTTGDKTKLTTDFDQANSLTEITRFVRGKFAPPVAILANIIEGEDTIGEPTTVKSILANNFVPLLVQDARDVYHEKHGGINGLAWAMGAYGIGGLGEGLGTYKAKDNAPKKVEKFTEQAKEAGLPTPPQGVLDSMTHKTHLDSISGRTPGDIMERMKKGVAYYAETTGDHRYDALVERVIKAKSAADAEELYSEIRSMMIDPGLAEYVAAIKERGVK